MKAVNQFLKRPYFYIFIIIIGTALKFYGLQSKFFWLDEIYTIFHTSGMQAEKYLASFPSDSIVSISEYHDTLNLNNGKHQIGEQLLGLSKMPQFTPLHYAFLVFWTKIAGADYLDYRLFTLLMFLLALPMIYLLAMKLLKSKLSALIVTAFFSVSPYIHLFAQEARYYMLWLLCIVLVNLVFLEALEKKKTVWWFLYFFSALVSIYVSMLSGLILFGHFIFVMFINREQRTQCVIALLLVSIAYAPWMIALIGARGEIATSIGWQMGSIGIGNTLIGPWFGLAQVFSHTQGFWDYWGVFVQGTELSAGMYFAITIHVLLIALIIASIIFIARKMDFKTRWYLFLLIIPGILFFYFLDMTGRWITFCFRYHMINYIGVLLVVSCFLGQKISSGKVTYSSMFIIVVGLGVFSSIHISRDDCFSAFGSSYGKVAAADLFSNDEKPLVISDASTDLGLIGLLETIIAASSDNIDIYYTAAPCNIDSVMRENKYSSVYLYQASNELINKIHEQLFASGSKDLLPPVILADKYINACLENNQRVSTDNYRFDMRNIRSDTCCVRFIVKPGIMPESSDVYITGNHSLLGFWQSGTTRLTKESDGSWTGTFNFCRDDVIEYKLTRGTWETESVDKNGRVMQNLVLNVKKDTVITIEIEKWKDL